MDIRSTILECLDELGIIVQDDGSDFDLQEYIVDSLQFITLIVSIEQKFNVEMPESMLLYEKMKSFNGYCEAVYELVQSQQNVEIE